MGNKDLPQELKTPSASALAGLGCTASAGVEELKKIILEIEPRLQPIPLIRRHVSRFVDGADMDEVVSRLWLGDCDAATNKGYLLRHGITHVLNAADNKTGPAQVKTGAEFYKGTPIKYLGLDLIDLPFANVARHFDKATNFIADALSMEGSILVHCKQGRSRSASIVIAYLMMYKNYTLADALRRLREIRDVRPNNSFLQQLADFELQLYHQRLENHNKTQSSESDSSSEFDSASETSESSDSNSESSESTDSDSEANDDLTDSESESSESTDSDSAEGESLIITNISNKSSEESVIVSKEKEPDQEIPFESCLEMSIEASILLFVDYGTDSEEETGSEKSNGNTL